MHAAPPVRMNLSTDPRWHAFIVICTSAAAANFGAWFASQAEGSLTAGGVSALVSAVLAGGLTLILLRRSNSGGVLSWDGAVWRWAPATGSSVASDPVAGDVRVVIDLGIWILVRFRSAPPRHDVVWWPVSRRFAGALWPAWRTALFSRPADPATTNDPP
jgi:hypothetical protein